MKINSFVFNPFYENTYLITSANKECIIIDPGMYSKQEKKEFLNFIIENNLKPVKLINTHCHLDHIIANKFIFDEFGLQPEINEGDIDLLKNIVVAGSFFGINAEPSPLPKNFLNEGDTIYLGNEELKVLFVPGHSPGHIALVIPSLKSVLSGDLLFKGSIGRTDLPGGNFNILINSIKNKLFSLPDDYIVYSGHGEPTTIGNEKKFNPFLQ